LSTFISNKTYSLASLNPSINEGSTATFILTTTNVASGTSLAYTLSGISLADIPGGSLSGNAVVNASGVATISIPTVADKQTEGSENLTLTIQGQTASVTIIDTSTYVNPNDHVTLVEGFGQIKLYRNSDGSQSVLENGVYYPIKDTAYGGNTNGPQSGFVAADFYNGVRVAVYNDGAIWYMNSSWSKDRLGPNSQDTGQVDSAQVSSLFLSNATPIYLISAASISVDEGYTVTFTLTTTNVASGTSVPYTLSGVSAADVAGGFLSGSVTVNSSGVATISVGIVADSLTEGAETLTVTAQSKTSFVTINDTSTNSVIKSWTKLLGTSGDDSAWALTTGPDGSIYVSGTSYGALDGQTNGGGIDAFLTKYSADGTKAWTKLLGTSGSENAYALTTGLDGSIYMSGDTSGALDGQTNSGGNDAFLTKYSTDGTKVWTKLLGTSGTDYASALTTGLDGSIYASGWTDGSLGGQTNSGGNDAFLTKYSADGTKAWTNLLGSSGNDGATALTTGLDGSIYVSGWTDGALGGQTNSGSWDAFLSKYSANGTKAWTKLLGSSSTDIAKALTTGLDGSIYVSGYTGGALDGQTNSGGQDAFLTKYSVDGTKAWTKLLGTSGDDGTLALITGLDGSIYVSGYAYGALDGHTNSGGYDAFLTKYSTDGTKAWTKLLGTSGLDQANALTTGHDGSIYVSGVTNGAFDGQTNSGSYDAFLAKYQDSTYISKATPTYSLSATSASVDEGTVATFNLLTTNVSAGSSISYTISGVSSADITGGALSGLAIVNSSGTATISIPIIADSLTEGPDTLTVTAQGKSASMTINDTSRTIERATAGSDTITNLWNWSQNIDGGAGVDTLVYYSNSYGIMITKLGESTLVTNPSGEVDTLINVERIKFSDLTVALDISGTAGQAYRVYQAAFNRTPDLGGLGYWISGMDGGASLKSVAQGFVDSAEFKILYGASPTNAQIVTKFYENVLHRAPESGGYNYWLGILNSRQGTVADVLAAFSESPENQSGVISVIEKGMRYTPYISPTYTLSASATTVKEGAVATFTLKTTNVAAGTAIGYTISGISAADVFGAALSGNAVVSASGVATISVSLLNDLLTEGAETLKVTAGGATASIVVSDTSVKLVGTVVDSSLGGDPGGTDPGGFG
jgi:hypothetical protein